MKSLAFVLALSCAAQPVYACHPRPDPLFGVKESADLAYYQRIVVGEVVAVRLTEHINQLQARDSHVEVIEIMGGSPPFDFEVYPIEVMKGSADRPQHFKAGGCLVAEPALHDRVIVFESADGWARIHVLKQAKEVVASPEAESYLDDVRACIAGACRGDEPR